MDIGVFVHGMHLRDGWQDGLAPWFVYGDALKAENINIHVFENDMRVFESRFDAMMLYIWQDWGNTLRWDNNAIMPIMCKYSEYRSRYPDVVQIICNHVDWCRIPYATWYWRSGDPVLYRTPAYDRKELAPLPEGDIWPWEMCWGSPCFSRVAETRGAGFIGTPSGPEGYREAVARNVSQVGIGECLPDESRIDVGTYRELMSTCKIIVCPRGWGETSSRHWDTWRSKKPMLTDRHGDMVEMIPGKRLREGHHYLVFDSPAHIPDIVSDWTKPNRRDDLERIAHNGWLEAITYDPIANISRFFRSAVPRTEIRERSGSSHGGGARC